VNHTSPVAEGEKWGADAVRLSSHPVGMHHQHISEPLAVEKAAAISSKTSSIVMDNDASPSVLAAKQCPAAGLDRWGNEFFVKLAFAY
jgi:hypothetical protein